ncbi:restriction endonuclease [Psychrobacillus sp. NPDC096389]|uniref:restriction endonuclease n=1 Tax=Psychrobacillus sp. NPDC096389 TaxID=3364490 RepID=UPI003819940A
MRNRTKKEQKRIDELARFILIVAALIGWYTTKTLIGTGIAIGIGLAVMILLAGWRAASFRKRMQQSGIAEIDQMSGMQFEEYVGSLFQHQGYKVSYTSTTGDFGADLILNKGKETIVVQAKRYKNSVGVKAVQEVIPSMNMYNASAAWVITNSVYTKQALILAKKNKVRMIDRDELIQMSLEMQNTLKKENKNVSTMEGGSTISNN